MTGIVDKKIVGASSGYEGNERCGAGVKNQNDIQSVKIDTNKQSWLPGLVDGLSVMPLHNFETEHAALVKWESNTIFNPHQHWGGEEILVLEGVFYDEFGAYPKGTWLRNLHDFCEHIN